jgi:glycogen operon protein
VLNRIKLIAEPWDIGDGGYQVGNFPLGWAEWNDRCRDAMRAYWRGDGGIIGEFARRLTGSSDLYGRGGRKPFASINFVAAHDGFSLHDVVSYNEKHNEANGEENRDGHDHNLSWNCGVEGPTDDAEIVALRERQKRNLLATVLLSQGVPMLLAGDERGRSQGGSNNAYCQDNKISWQDWSPLKANERLAEFTRMLIELRKSHRSFRRRDFFQGRPLHGGDVKDIHWLNSDASELSDEQWDHEQARCLGVYLAGGSLGESDRFGMPASDDDFLLLFNSHHEDVDFALPSPGGDWQGVIDTFNDDGLAHGAEVPSGAAFTLRGRSFALFTRDAQHA